MSIGVEGGLTAPLGDFSDGAGLGIGVLGEFAFAINQQFRLTATTGLVYHLSQDFLGASLQLTEFPLLLGARVHVAKPVFVFGQIGPMLLRRSLEGGDSDTDDFVATRFGVAYDAGPVAVGVGVMFSNIEKPNESASLTFAASVPLTRF